MQPETALRRRFWLSGTDLRVCCYGYISHPHLPENGGDGHRREGEEELEGEDLDLERGVELYKEACECVRWCGQKLKEARNELETQRGELVDAERFLQEAGDAFERAPERRQDKGQDYAAARGRGRSQEREPFSSVDMASIPF